MKHLVGVEVSLSAVEEKTPLSADSSLLEEMDRVFLRD